MVYTVTFNPSLDYVIWVKEFTLGNSHRAESEELYAGGKGINVSTVLKQLDVDNVALGFVAGFTGQEVIRRMDEMGIPSDFILLRQGTSRINIHLKTEGSTETDVNGLGPVVEQKNLEQFYKKLECIQEGDFLVLSGSVPQSIKDRSDVYSHICKLANTKNVKFVVDAEGDFLRKTLREKPFLIKPNQYELGMLFGRELTSEEAIIECAIQLHEEGATNVLVSRAAEGALLIDAYGHVLRQTAPEGVLMNSVGAGDSMVAGFLAGLLRKHKVDRSVYTPEDYQYALKLGVAAGSASAFSGTFPDKGMIEKIQIQMGIK